MKFRVGASALALIAASSALALAQERTADKAAAKSKAQVEEITVTATRREESLQRVPVAVQALTSARIKEVGALSLKDLQYTIPNLQVGGNATNRRPDIVLRGIQSATRVPGFEGSIGFFVDGVYKPFPNQWNNPLMDAERVEVIYGPQDTLFGKNTIAGAINVTTKRPGTDFGAELTAEGGNYSYYNVRGAVDVPLVQGLLYSRVSGIVNDRDGYVKNLYNGDTLNDQTQAGGRLDLRLTPTNRFEANLMVSGFYDRQHLLQGKFVGNRFSTPDPLTASVNITPKSYRHLYDVRLGMDYDLDNGYRLSSITAWSKADSWFRTDEDGNPFELWFTNIVDFSNYFSQDLRITSPTDQKVSFISGVYYGHSFWAQPGSLEVLPGDPINPPGGLGQLGPDGKLKYNDYDFRNVSVDSYAVYATADWHISDRLTARAGLRVTHDDKRLFYPGQINFGRGFLGSLVAPGSFYYPNLPAFTGALSKTAITESGGLDYRLTDDVMIYAKIATGYKAGGWNTDLYRISGSATTASAYKPAQFKPEHVTDYEVGVKADLWNKRVRSNTSFFYADYKDKQETVFISITEGFRISNAGGATLKGFEEQLDVVLADGLVFNGALGYVDPIYDDFQYQATLNYKGQQLVFASKLSGSAGFTYTVPITGLGDLSVHGDATYRSKAFLDLANPVSARNYVGGYTLVNSRVSLDLKDGKTQLYAFGRNLGDRRYMTCRYQPAGSGFSGGTGQLCYGEPRMYGAGVTYKF